MLAIEYNRVRNLRDLGLLTVASLESDLGVLASSRGELYGCIFGRDSCITALLLLAAHAREPHPEHVDLVRKIVFNLGALQGTEHNPQSGEEPGKIIHEYRPDRHEHLTRDNNWFLYDDGSMKSYDSVDATPLFLMTAYELATYVDDREDYLHGIERYVRAGLTWILAKSDEHPERLVAYGTPAERTHGGLYVQNWMDSTESLFHEDGTAVTFPVAPIEVQAYAHAALSMWAHHYRTQGDAAFADSLQARARDIKAAVQRHYIISREPFCMASGLNGAKKPVMAVRSSLGHILWAAWRAPQSEAPNALLDASDLQALVQRLFAPDLFDARAGFRTLSQNSSHFADVSYHNGSVWPHDTALIAEGLLSCGYTAEARRVRNALFQLWSVFHTPLEFVVIEDGLVCRGRDKPGGQKACLEQAWSAAAMVSQMGLLLDDLARREAEEDAGRDGEWESLSEL